MEVQKLAVLKLREKIRELQRSGLTPIVEKQLEQLSENAIRKTDVVLNQLTLVLDALLKFETQNELLEIVRKMIRQQEDIVERTKQERQRQDFDRLLK